MGVFLFCLVVVFLWTWYRAWKALRKIFSLRNYSFSSPPKYFLATNEVLIRFHSGMENCWVNHFNSTTTTCGDSEGWFGGPIWVAAYLSHSRNCMLSASQPSLLRKSPLGGLKTWLPTQFWKIRAADKDVFGKLFATGFVTASLFNRNQRIGWNLT